MSPRRKVEADEHDFFDVPKAEPKEPVNWRMVAISGVVSLLMIAGITLSTLLLVSHDRDSYLKARDASALGYVREFMTVYTTLDPFNANAYADRIVAQGTGEFEKSFKERSNEILVQIARGEPTTGSVLEAGVQRWNNDESADVLVATKVTTKSPDGKQTIESGNRWVATVTEVGEQWKISNLIQVI